MSRLRCVGGTGGWAAGWTFTAKVGVLTSAHEGREVAIPVREDLRRIQRAIEAAPPTCRHVFLLRRVHGRSVVEIAAETGLSVRAVEGQLGKMILLLLRAIAEEETTGDAIERQEAAVFHFVPQLDERSYELPTGRAVWLDADPRNAVAYARVETIWEQAKDQRNLLPGPDHDRAPPSANASSGQGHDQQ